MFNDIYLDELLISYLKEDMPSGDITTDSIIDSSSVSKGRFISKDEGIIAGLYVAKRVFQILDPETIFLNKVSDGDQVKKGQVIAEIEGNTSALLKGERVALNLLQHLSGVATTTYSFSKKIEGFPCRIADTRKTTPGLRLLEKYAVRVGGGSNHRISLSDGVLIKDNHIKAAGGIKKAVELARKKIPHTIKIEVETETIEEVLEALDAGADIIMLDNMSIPMMREAVEIINKRALVEASGNVNINNVQEIARVGVDIISVGAITHSVKALDISLKFN
ncbi:MAG TPA: carboxylating nicotinate-nucleotide diphosphorylase [Clostridiaceae bacterium]|nr:carboxylating nicotinate-nucleotide diphosphorylase [Clostridiaceae bacterium]